MQIKNHTLILSIALTFMFALGFYVFAAWTGPSQTPPNGNTDAPINVGATKQAKAGGIEMTYAVLTPGNAPTGANGTMYYDSTAKKFKCYQDGNFIDCIGGGYLKIDDSATPDANILIVVNPGRTDKAARITNLLTPVNPSDAATKAYVDAQLGGGGSSGGATGVKNLWEREFVKLGSVTWLPGDNSRKTVGTLPLTKTSFDLVACLEEGPISSCAPLTLYNNVGDEGQFPEAMVPILSSSFAAFQTAKQFGSYYLVSANCYTPDGGSINCVDARRARVEIINPQSTTDIMLSAKNGGGFTINTPANLVVSRVEVRLTGTRIDAVSASTAVSPSTFTLWYR